MLTCPRHTLYHHLEHAEEREARLGDKESGERGVVGEGRRESGVGCSGRGEK